MSGSEKIHQVALSWPAVSAVWGPPNTVSCYVNVHVMVVLLAGGRTAFAPFSPLSRHLGPYHLWGAKVGFLVLTG